MSLQVNFNILNKDDKVQTYEAGEKIFEEGQTGKVMYYIRAGEVSIESNGEEISTLGAGDIFGEMALIDTTVRFADAVAKSECQIVTIDERYFNFLIHEHPFFAVNVMRVLADRLRKKTQA
ncbi:MAG: cyclic nucleotide-binding domain-containing protein [Methylococcaceae bacterium]|nr:cyclic nucleotide-binding domain-containing protein [Methylococcaceae bacterium]